MNGLEFRHRGREMVDYLVDYLDNIDARRVTPNIEPGYLQDLIPKEPPEYPEDWDWIPSCFPMADAPVSWTPPLGTVQSNDAAVNPWRKATASASAPDLLLHRRQVKVSFKYVIF